MQLESWNDVITLIALCLSVISTILGYFTLKIRQELSHPIIRIVLEEFPTLDSEVSVTLKNEGGRAAKLEGMDIMIDDFTDLPYHLDLANIPLLAGGEINFTPSLILPEDNFSIRIFVKYSYGWPKKESSALLVTKHPESVSEEKDGKKKSTSS